MSTDNPGSATDLLRNSSLYREFQAEREEILKHKWIESEKAGTDIGFEKALLDWINRARQAVHAYFGAFPVPSLKLSVSFSAAGRGVSHGKTFGYRGALIRISVGQHTTEADLEDDWMLVHEMVHLGFPSVGEDQHSERAGHCDRADAGQTDAARHHAAADRQLQRFDGTDPAARAVRQGTD